MFYELSETTSRSGLPYLHVHLFQCLHMNSVVDCRRMPDFARLDAVYDVIGFIPHRRITDITRLY